MARLVLLKDPKSLANKTTDAPVHRASATEGEAAKRLLESEGYVLKRTANGQHEFRCPFHEGPGQIEPRKGTNFYVNAESSMYSCHAGSCGEKGNLKTLERHFGIEADPGHEYQSRETMLKQFELCLTPSLRKPFYEHGLTDATIERFRLGWDQEKQRYVIPYLEGRRPVFFRYYQPDGDPQWKYTWEEGAQARLYNPSDAFGDKEGRVFICEGEQKAMLLVQMGYAAVAVAGATQWKDEYQAQFTHAKQIFILFDNDNPEHHIYDKPEKQQVCHKCKNVGRTECAGHNPGQEAAVQRLENLGWRAKNIVLPRPEGARKVDINDYFMRDGYSNADFAELVFGTRKTPYKVTSLADLIETPPEQATFLVDQGILPKGGRLLIAGKPKVGKSIFVDNLALSLASGIPFLKQFPVDHPTRTLLLDRELSKGSLFKRLSDLMEDRVGYKAAVENLLIDHDHLIRLDMKEAYEVLYQLIEQNGAEVIILDTAYKFMGGDVESSSALMKAFDTLDKLIHKTGVSIVMTHHIKKGSSHGKDNKDVADPDGVAGSFLWTGWPNSTILLNYLSRSVENPFNSVCTFTSFRDAAPPEPLALYRDRSSIAYNAITAYSHQEDTHSAPVTSEKPTSEGVANLLLDLAPTTEDDFLHVAAGHYGVKVDTVRPYLLDVLSQGHFIKTNGRPPLLKFAAEETGEITWDQEHGLAAPPGFEDVDMFAQDAAALR